MSREQLIYNAVRSTDIDHRRLMAAIVVSVLVHAAALVGLPWEAPASRDHRPEQSLDVALVESAPTRPSDEARHIAEQDQQGHGERDHAQQPPGRPPTAGDEPSQGSKAENQKTATQADGDERNPEQVSEAATASKRDDREAVEGQREAQPPTPRAEAEQTPERPAPPAPGTREKQPAPSPEEGATDAAAPKADGRSLAQRSLAMAQSGQLSSQDRASRRSGQGKRHLHATSTKSAVEASYLRAWVRKVERVGAMNYPSEARRRDLGGSLILHVTLDDRGQLVDVEVGRSSGYKVLDEAATHIVELAAPFAPFPTEMRKRYDQLVITRTWVFRDHDRQIRMR